MSNIKKIEYCGDNQIPIGNYTVHFYWEKKMYRRVNGLYLEWVGGYTYDAGLGNDYSFTNSKEDIYLERITKGLDYTKKSYVDDIRKAMELDPYKE
jgi:hypothetical protein